MLKLRVMVRWLLLLVIYSASLSTSPLYAVDAIWVGGTNFLWHIPSNWSGNAAPNSSDFNVFIDSNAGVNSSVTLQSSVGPITIGNLTIDAGDGLLIGAPLTTSGIAGAGSIAIFDTTLTLGHGVFSGVLLSNGNVTLNQPGETIFLGTYFSGSSANTYTGLTTIENDAVLHLDKSNNTNAISGDVLITSGGELTYFSLTAVLKHENIIDTAKVTIADGKWWNFTGSNVGYVETITDLEFTGAGATGGEVSGDGLNFELKILGSISHTGEGLNDGLIRGVLLNLNGGNRTIHTASDAVLRIDSRLSNGGVNKTGDGTVALRGINDYAGGTTLNGGTLSLLNSSALGTGLVTFQAGTIDYRYYNSGSPSSINIANPITLEANATLHVGNVVDLFGPHTPTQSGVISETGGPRGVTKTGPGDLILSAVNSFTGTAHINEGAARTWQP